MSFFPCKSMGMGFPAAARASAIAGGGQGERLGGETA
jgi:hypothetical protein